MILLKRNVMIGKKNLWLEIFEKDKWQYPKRDFLTNELKEDIGIGNIFCFSLNYLPTIFHRFIDKIAKDIDVYDLILSPCELFWEDIVTDYEKKKIEKIWKHKKINETKRKELSDYYSVENPLLSNYGKLGREYSKAFEECYFDEVFVPPKTDGSLLHNVQQDLLSMRNISNESIPFIKDDDSIQLHIASSKLREIEILHNNLLLLISNDQVQRENIEVIVSSIDEYLPYIHMVFGQGKIDYRISDINMTKQSNFASAFLCLLSLINGKWEKEAIISLFENPSFRRKANWSKDEFNLIKEWINKSNVAWGIDSSHKSSFLDTDLTKEALHKHTWDDAIERILFELVVSKSEIDPSHFNIEMSQAEVFDKLLQLFSSLKKDIFYLQNDEGKNLYEIVDILRNLVDKYFYIEEEEIKENSFLRTFENFLQSLIKANDNYFENETFSKKTILKLLLNCLRKTQFSYGSNRRNAIHFTSYKEGVYPSDVICLVGMQHDFPKVVNSSSLDLLKNRKEKPKEIDHLRYTFLEVLLSSRKKLFISYRGYSQENGDELPPSFLVSDFLSYIDSAYIYSNKKVSKEITIKHPTLSFDKSYFSNTKLKSTINDYQLAKEYYKGKEVKKHSFFSLFTNEKEDVALPTEINIKELVALAKNPIKYYINRILGIYLENEQKDEEFTLSSLDKYIFREKLKINSFDEVFDSFKSIGKIPIGMMEKVIKKTLFQEMNIYEKSLRGFGLEKKDVFSIEFIDGCKAALQLDNGDFHLPPIELSIENKKVRIVGQLQNCTNVGLLCYAKDTWRGLFNVWPEYLIYNYACNSISNDSSKLLMMRSGKVKDISVEDIKSSLSSYILYYWRSQKAPSPLIDGWIDGVIFEDIEKLTKEINNSLSTRKGIDPYFSWAFSDESQDFSAKEICIAWSNFSQSVFKEIKEKKAKC